ncbi:MAG TPA: HD domain-containing phosphohydrolase [Devosia sp.]|jgi:HD-GYP domain-containing protein (c-di-GMP phosphodiesterase class II)|nr:HD domain-containing phosphohydrolase [Devosia sp.]
MPASDEIELAELVSALSYALDLTEGQPAGHSVRACWIGIHVGMELGLSAADLTELYYTILLKDVGCSSNAARICQLYVTDDLTMKAAAKFLDHTPPQFLWYLISHAGMKRGLVERFRIIVETALKTGEIAHELTDTRCHRGADIARTMRFSETVAQGITDLDEHWDGTGQPANKPGEAISLFARIALLAQVTDVFFTSEGPLKAMAEVARRSGTWFDPRLVQSMQMVAARPDFWRSLSDPLLQQRVVDYQTVKASRPVDEDYLDDIAAAFAQVIDAKTPYTSGHSDRVALFSDLIAGELAMDPLRRRRLRRAALLHDIGKLGVSNQTLDKPGKLDAEEWAEIKRHPALGELVLSRVAAFSDLAEVAAQHHERLDGAGYPRGLPAEKIGLESRIVAVADVFDALTADRPYRKAMTATAATAILAEMAGPALDPLCVAALQRGLSGLDAEAQAA